MVMLGDNNAFKFLGLGSITIKMFDGCCWTLQNVRYCENFILYVLDLKRNLISVRMLYADGCTVKIDIGSIKIIKGAMIIMKGSMKNDLYILDGENHWINHTCYLQWD